MNKFSKLLLFFSLVMSLQAPCAFAQESALDIPELSVPTMKSDDQALTGSKGQEAMKEPKHKTITQAKKLQLVFPVACELGNTCYIDRYNPDEKGINIALVTYAEMRKGVPVLASISGQVTQVINDKPDNYGKIPPNILKNQACGNGIVIKNQNGSEVLYCHLKQFSLKVIAGSKVEAGQEIAKVGDSGIANFPHLYFSVTQNKKPIDLLEDYQWTPPIKQAPMGIINQGLTNQIPSLDAVQDKTINQTIFYLDDPVVIAWIRMYGVNKGMQQRFVFYQPNGYPYRSALTSVVTSKYKDWFAYGGYRIKDVMTELNYGVWSAVYQLRPNNKAEWQTIATYGFELKPKNK